MRVLSEGQGIAANIAHTQIFSKPYLSNRNQIGFVIFRLIWNQTDASVWFQINRCMVNTIRFRFYLIRLPCVQYSPGKPLYYAITFINTFITLNIFKKIEDCIYFIIANISKWFIVSCNAIKIHLYHRTQHIDSTLTQHTTHWLYIIIKNVVLTIYRQPTSRCVLKTTHWWHGKQLGVVDESFVSYAQWNKALQLGLFSIVRKNVEFVPGWQM